MQPSSIVYVNKNNNNDHNECSAKFKFLVSRIFLIIKKINLNFLLRIMIRVIEFIITTIRISIIILFIRFYKHEVKKNIKNKYNMKIKL